MDGGRKKPVPPNRFKRGQSGNPTGPCPIPRHLRPVQEVTRPVLGRIFGMIAAMKVEELEWARKHGDLTAIERVIVEAFAVAIEKGDFMRIAPVLDRYLPREAPVAPTVIDVESLKTTDEGALVAMARRALAVMEEQQGTADDEGSTSTYT